MQLKHRVALNLAIAVAGFVVLSQVAQRFALQPRLDRLEARAAREDVQRAALSVRRELDALGQRAREWGHEDATWALCERQNETLVAAHLDPRHPGAHGLHVVRLFGREGNVLWSSLRDPETDEELSLPGLSSQALDADLERFARGRGRGEQPARSGALAPLEDGRQLLVASHPILHSDGSGPARGTLVLGRFLEPTRVGFELIEGTSSQWTENEQRILTALSTADGSITRAGDDGRLVAYARLDAATAGSSDDHPLILRAHVEPRLGAEGRTAQRTSLFTASVLGLGLWLVLVVILQRSVLGPLLALVHYTVGTGGADDEVPRPELDRADEIGDLARELDYVLEELERSRLEATTAAGLAGLSEIASGVLHNVGNALNSVNVSAEMVTRQIRNESVDDLARIVEVLDEHEQDLATFISEDPKGKHLHPLLRSLARKLVDSRSAATNEMEGLASGLGHIKVLIRAQQAYAKGLDVMEPTDLAELFETTVEMSFQIRPPEDDLVVQRVFDEVPQLLLDRNKLMQILVNLVLNARQAMTAAEVHPPTLHLAVRDAGEEVLLEVGDNGEGIREENLEKLFTHGFTTKKDGHGFGLHTAAKTAAELRGALRVTSNGPGQGALFTLALPNPAAKKAPAAPAPEATP